ncbi:hypothetical protein [Nocardia abscessus]|uniref:hypothetical protein n=1 Tax=Nocardia abscessus TaxID=120957 RepID=UPI00355721EA
MLIAAAREAGTEKAAWFTVGSSVNFRDHLDGAAADTEVGTYQGMIATPAKYARGPRCGRSPPTSSASTARGWIDAITCPR